MQDALNLIPDVASPEFLEAANVESNDEMLCLFVGTLSRSVVALHDLIENKLSLREREKGTGDAKKKDDKDKDGKDKDSKEKVALSLGRLCLFMRSRSLLKAVHGSYKD